MGKQRRKAKNLGERLREAGRGRDRVARRRLRARLMAATCEGEFYERG